MGDDDGSAFESRRRRSMIVICVSSMLLVGLAVAVLESYVSHQKNNAKNTVETEAKTSTKAIESLCEPTDFKKTCIDSLSSAAGNKSDPKTLILDELQAAVERISKAAQTSLILHEDEKDKDSMVAKALSDCRVLLESAMTDLKRTSSVFIDFDSGDVGTLKTWLSAAITFHEACLDGLRSTNNIVARRMEISLNASAELARNGLAMVDQFSSMHNTLEIHGLDRRLVDDGPIWIDMERRQIMEANPGALKPDITVAQDGSGNVTTIYAALRSVPQNSVKPFVIYVKEGIYNESVRVETAMTNLVLIGDGPDITKITWNKNFADGVPTYRTATFGVAGENFIAKNIAFENSAGPEKHEGIALRVRGDKAILHNCHINGHQETLNVHAYRQFYRDCTIAGTIDIIVGDASALFQNCKIVIRKPGPDQQCTVTAQRRKDHRECTGIVLHGCRIVGDDSYLPHRKTNKAYLGRPLKEFSRTIVMDTYIDESIDPAGWMGDLGQDTCFFGEFNNHGPGSGKDRRVKWMGIKDIDAVLAGEFVPVRFFEGDNWIAATGVPYFSGLTSKNGLEISPSPQPSKGSTKKTHKRI